MIELQDVFADNSDCLCRFTVLEYAITTIATAPLKQLPRRRAWRKRALIKDKVNKMLEQGVIQPAQSPFSSPSVLVKKKDGEWQFCIDYRWLNEMTTKDVYPLPRIDDALSKLGGAALFSVVDLQSGYWQLPVTEADKPKTAFVTQDGLYRFRIMSFRLCSEPSTFQRLMHMVLAGWKWADCPVYMDDVVISGKVAEEHLERLRKVLSCSQKANLKLKMEKCTFGNERVQILGYVCCRHQRVVVQTHSAAAGFTQSQRRNIHFHPHSSTLIRIIRTHFSLHQRPSKDRARFEGPDKKKFSFEIMADLKRLLALRSGSRVIAARLIEKLKNVFVDENMEPSREIHELESKLTELKTWYDTLEDFDQQILLVTEKEELQKEIKKTYVENSIIQDAGDLCHYRINVMASCKSRRCFNSTTNTHFAFSSNQSTKNRFAMFQCYNHPQEYKFRQRGISAILKARSAKCETMIDLELGRAGDQYHGSILVQVKKGTGTFYDPLGFYAPFAVSGKMLIQDLCMKKVKVDEELDSDHLKRWKEIGSSIVEAIKQQIMSVKRSYFGAASAVRNLHIFCDASRRAYGVVSYLVHQGEVSFVESKARITPIMSHQREEDKELSIPESELMASYLGVFITSIIILALEPLGFKLKIYLWSDSQIVHHWIFKEDGRPHQFITNHVKKIRDFNRTHAATWKYVSSADNPADILSRGASFKQQLQASKLWKVGQEWFKNRKKWPTWSVTEFKNSKVMHVVIPSATAQVKRICRGCVKCRKVQGSSYKLPDLAPLPVDRVRQLYLFAVTGIDYKGSFPICVKEGEDSVYILLFTCVITRAIHLEAVENMTPTSMQCVVLRVIIPFPVSSIPTTPRHLEYQKDIYDGAWNGSNDSSGFAGDDGSNPGEARQCGRRNEGDDGAKRRRKGSAGHGTATAEDAVRCQCQCSPTVRAWRPSVNLSATAGLAENLLHQYVWLYKVVRQVTELNCELWKPKGKKTIVIHVSQIKKFVVESDKESESDEESDKVAYADADSGVERVNTYSGVVRADNVSVEARAETEAGRARAKTDMGETPEADTGVTPDTNTAAAAVKPPTRREKKKMRGRPLEPIAEMDKGLEDGRDYAIQAVAESPAGLPTRKKRAHG
ncbi:Uncharacterized protein APZ42_029040 [Daphnia magna]|uniref:Reverse transcriptase domain-containing protein n=1 Tax=Daphnia magna TaxID=35525 RepID=A0A164PYV5_9CRUS|nr:Uncharacterized protein APZ42_029040 [Daphnia magna]